MSAAISLRARSEVGRESWDAFVEASGEAWLWHRWDLIEALALWDGHGDASFALVDDRGAILAILPLHRNVVRVVRLVPLVRFISLGGPACAGGLSAKLRTNVLSVLREQLTELLADSTAISVEAQVAALTPWLNGAAAPRVNPLIFAGFESTQTETWSVDLARSEADIRNGYSELTRRELRKAWQGDIRLREATSPKDVDIYYRLHLETYGRTGAKPHPIEYFQAIFEKFQPRGLAHILFAERDGKVVAAQNTGRYKAGAVYWTGASVSDKEGGENRVLFDAQIMAARAAGCTRYETGQAFVNSKDAKESGLSRFKRSFGAEIHPFYRGVLRSPRLSLRLVGSFRDVLQTVKARS